MQSGNFSQDVLENLSEIKQAVRIPEFNRMLAYILLSGLLVPTFDSFQYFFLLDVVGISKFTFSMLTMLTFACFLIGTQLYNKYFQDKEYRHLVMMEAIISLLVAPLTLIFVLRLNLDWGIPDMALLIFNDIIRDVVGQFCVWIPTYVILGKICPNHIEATSYAILSGALSFRGSLRDWLGSIVNEQWVGVTEMDLSKYWVLVVIGWACHFLPLFLVWLIPTRESIAELQQRIVENKHRSS